MHSISGIAQTDEPHAAKRAWQWSADERIAARLDPAFVEKHTKRNPSDPGKATFSIDGRQDPHVFLPFELFVFLLGGLHGDAANRDVTRAMMEDRIKSFGYADPSAFWRELETVAAPYLTLLKRNAALHVKMQTAPRPERAAIAEEIESSHIPLCRSRAEALAAARAHFGRETFDRFLYTVVAPQVTTGSVVPSADEARGLAYLEGGCR